MFHHDCDSSKINYVAYDPDRKELHISFKPKGSVYIYSDVPGATPLLDHFNNTKSAKKRNVAIGAETPGSEGSYLIYHVIGLRGIHANPPYPFRKAELAVKAS